MAELAAVVATGRAGTEDGRSGPHVIRWLLLDGVYLQAAGTAIYQGVVAAADVDLVPAEATPPFGDAASPPAHLTLHPVVVEWEIISSFVEFGDGGARGFGRGGHVYIRWLDRRDLSQALRARAGNQPRSQRGEEPFLEKFPSGPLSCHGHDLVRWEVGLDEGG